MTYYKMKWVKAKAPKLFESARNICKKQMRFNLEDTFLENDLAHVFIWEDTKEGFDYWQEKHEMLKQWFKPI